MPKNYTTRDCVEIEKTGRKQVVHKRDQETTLCVASWCLKRVEIQEKHERMKLIRVMKIAMEGWDCALGSERSWREIALNAGYLLSQSFNERIKLLHTELYHRSNLKEKWIFAVQNLAQTSSEASSRLPCSLLSSTALFKPKITCLPGTVLNVAIREETSTRSMIGTDQHCVRKKLKNFEELEALSSSLPPKTSSPFIMPAASQKDLASGMDHMCREIRRYGSLTGLRYVDFSLRSQEEIFIHIKERDGCCFQGNNIRVVEQGQSPSSPARERPGTSEGVILMLGVYRRYERPMVWCKTRSKEHTFQFEDVPGWSKSPSLRGVKSNHDYPIFLQSSANWQSYPTETTFYHFLSEIFNTFINPPPANPLAVDFASPLLSQPSTEKLLSVSSLINVLSHLPPTDEIQKDVEKLHKIYAQEMLKIASEG